MPIDEHTMDEVKRFLDDPPPRFADTEPFFYAKRYAREHECDLAVPGGPIGLGSMICFTPLVEAMARRLGRPLRLLTMPPIYTQTDFPVWEHNPYISEIVNANDHDPDIMLKLIGELDNFPQPAHVINNICAAYRLRPRRLRGTLYLSRDEMQWGLRSLAKLERPVVCLCPYGTVSSPPGSPWHVERWQRLIESLDGRVSFVHIGYDMKTFNQKPLGVFSPPTFVRQAMALIWASDVYVGFNTGPTHMATALEVPTAALFDAIWEGQMQEGFEPGFGLASLSRWSYPQNENIVLLGERNEEILDRLIEFITSTLRALGHWRDQ